VHATHAPHPREPGHTKLRIFNWTNEETQMSTYAYPNPQAIFYQQFEAVRRDEVVGILLALFLGTFGLHHFYIRRTGLGILYLCFFWTGIPAILGFFECFFMPGRVREFNAIQAAGIAAALGIPMPLWSQPVAAYTPDAAQPFPAQPFAAQPAAAQPNPNQPAITDVGTLIACPKCRQTNPPTARFCSGCGGTL
jgi:TM2 domain-containing membrane protein YozV